MKLPELQGLLYQQDKETVFTLEYDVAKHPETIESGPILVEIRRDVSDILGNPNYFFRSTCMSVSWIIFIYFPARFWLEQMPGFRPHLHWEHQAGQPGGSLRRHQRGGHSSLRQRTTCFKVRTRSSMERDFDPKNYISLHFPGSLLTTRRISFEATRVFPTWFSWRSCLGSLVQPLERTAHNWTAEIE